MKPYNINSTAVSLYQGSMNSWWENLPIGVPVNTVTGSADMTKATLYGASGSLNGTHMTLVINGVSGVIAFTGSSNAISQSALITALNTLSPSIASVNYTNNLVLSSSSSFSVVTDTALAVLGIPTGSVLGTSADAYAATLSANFVSPVYITSDFAAPYAGAAFRGLTTGTDGTVIVNTVFRKNVTLSCTASIEKLEIVTAILSGGTATGIYAGF